MIGVRQKIINNLLDENTGLLCVNTENGYSNTIMEVFDKILSAQDVNNHPTICLDFESENGEQQLLNNSLNKKVCDLLLICYNNDVSKRESLILDIKKYFQGDTKSGQSFVCSFFEEIGTKYIQKYWDRQTVNGLSVGSFGIYIRIEYRDLIDEEVEPPIPTLILPVNGSGDESIYTQFQWNSNSSGSLKYEVQISTDNFNSIVFDKNDITDTSFTIPYGEELEEEINYYCRVRAKNIVGYGDWSTTHTFTISTSVTLEPETTLLANRHTVIPDSTRQGFMNTLIKLFKDSNLWDKLDVLQIYQSHSITNNDWGLNWRKNLHNATSGGTGALTLAVNTPVVTSGINCINLNFNPYTQGICFSKHRCSLGFKKLNDATHDGDIGLVGSNNDPLESSGFIQLVPRYSNGLYYIRLNTIGGALLYDTYVSPASAFHVITRGTSYTTSYYHNNTTVIENGVGQNPATVPNGNLVLGLGGVGHYGAFFCGTYITSSEKDIIINGINTYLTNIGAFV